MILLVLSLLYAGCIEVPRFIRKKEWKEGAVFSVLLIAGLTISVSQMFGWMGPFAIGKDIMELTKNFFPFVNSLGKPVL